MEDFLRSSRQALDRVSDDGHFHIVLCNESCDLDSAVSALVYSFYLHQTGAPGSLYIPVLDIPRSQYRLRTEITHLLSRHNIPPELLTFADDVDLASLAPRLDLTLVDHHVLRSQLSPLDQCVVRVIDHRPQEKQLDNRVSCTVDLVGSCCTLITEEITRDDTFTLDKTTATLLLGTILTDTINMNEAAGKTTARDRAAIDTLKLLLPEVDTQALFDGIHQAKTDVSGLSSEDLLKKDVKLVGGASLSIAMCSVMMSAQDFLHKDDVVAALGSFTTENGVDAVVMMLLSTPKGEPRRELAVYSPQRIYRQQIADVLESCSSPSLMLETISDGPDDIAVFNQGNVQASRKKVMPILKAFLNGEKTPDESGALSAVSFVSGGSTDGLSSLMDLPAQGESQQGHDSNQGLAALSPDTLDLFDPAASTHSAETSASSEGQMTGPSVLSKQLDTLSLGNEEGDGDTGLAARENRNESNVTSSTVLSPVGSGKRDDVSNIDLLNNFDPYALIPSADNEHNTGDTQRPSEFIDNLINTKVDNFELTEADVLQPISGQDFYSSGLESPMDFSSGQNSGQGSKVSSYPVTPPNSFMDVEYSGIAMDHDLPSFNSSEMVERIKAKKASIGADTEGNSLPQDCCTAQEEQDFTFTPQNSYSDSNMEKHLKETELPSFYNSEMVQRIREKRASLENAVNDTENNQDDLQDKFPWTPHNSYVEGSLDAFGRENLPSFNNSEMVRKVEEKRASLPSLDENENEAGASGSENSLGSVPFTPQNGGVEGREGLDGRHKDTTHTVDTTVGASPEMDHECTHNSVPHGNMIDFEMSNTAANNIVAGLIADEMQADISGDTAEALQVGRDQVSGRNNSDNVVASAISDQMKEERGLGDSFTCPPYSNGDSDGATIPASDVIEGLNSSASKEDNVSETPMNEVAFTLASELIQNALETFNPQVELSQVADHSETSVQSEGEVASSNPKPDEMKTGSAPKYLKTLSKSDSNTVSVETEYLPEMDPLRGNMDIIERGALETDADREVAESSSFRRISCEESSLTQVAEQQSGDASAVRKVIHIDSNLDMSLDDNRNDSDEEVSGLREDDSQSKKKRIHINSGDQSETANSTVDNTVGDSLERYEESGRRPHYSESAGERKEVYMTSAGRISIGVDQDVPVTAPAATHNTTQEKMKGVELKDEWQDDGFPVMLAEGSASQEKARPQTLGASADGPAKKKIVPDINLLSDEDASEGDVLENIDDLETPHDLDTPSDLEEGDLGELEWEKRIKKLKDDTPVLSPDDIDPIPEYTEQEEKHDARHWKTVTVGDKQYKIDLKVIEPYKKVLSHGGYYGDGLNAIILFSGCYLPDRRRKDYNYVMDNLFYYVVHTLEQLVAEDYMIVYFHGATPRRQMPSLSWLKKCYQMIDRRLRKNLKALLLVHPTLWLKTVVMMTRPFISSKFASKLRFVRTLQELSQLLPMDHVYVPDQVQSHDASFHSRPTQSTPSTPTSDPTSPQ